MVWLAQGSCFIRTEVRALRYFYLGEIAINVVIPVSHRVLYMVQD